MPSILPAEKQLIVTTNFTLEQLGAQIDDRLASRLVDMGPIIDLGEEDYRVERARKR